MTAESDAPGTCAGFQSEPNPHKPLPLIFHEITDIGAFLSGSGDAKHSRVPTGQTTGPPRQRSLLPFFPQGKLCITMRWRGSSDELKCRCWLPERRRRV